MRSPAYGLALCLVVAAGAGAARAGGDPQSDHHHGTPNAHLRLTTAHAPTAADEARYEALRRMLTDELRRFADVNVAVAEGYEPPAAMGIPKVVLHYTRRENARVARTRFDPLAPTSLIYRRTRGGDLRLVGVMYTAPPWFDEAQLDERVPLSVAPWHQHINVCVPGFAHRGRWQEREDGRPVFGPGSPIATAAECKAVGGHFMPRLAGWMVHVNLG